MIPLTERITGKPRESDYWEIYSMMNEIGWERDEEIEFHIGRLKGLMEGEE